MKNIKTKKHIKPEKQSSREFIVNEESSLLPFLLSCGLNKSRNHIKSLLAFGAITIDGKITKQFDTPLSIGQRVCVCGAPTQEQIEEAQLPKLAIIYEDDYLIAINKPYGLLSVASDTEKEYTAYRFLNEAMKKINSTNHIFVVHRLDRDTSGVLLFAKSEEIKLALQDNWDTTILKRGYTAVTEGVPSPATGVVHSWLLETKTHLVYSSEHKNDGLEAITEYSVKKQNELYALVSLKLKTGRKNQIRVHMNDLGTPIAGDKKYGATTNPLKRLALHADLLELTHPVTGERIRIEAKTPNGFFSCTGDSVKKTSDK